MVQTQNACGESSGKCPLGLRWELGNSSSGLSPIAGFLISSVEHLVYNTSHCEVCLATGPKRVIKKVRFNVSSFKFQYPLFYSRSSSSCLVFFFVFKSRVHFLLSFFSPMSFRRQFLPIRLAFFLLVHTIYSSPSWLYTIFLHFSKIGPTHLHPPASHSKTFQVFLICLQ